MELIRFGGQFDYDACLTAAALSYSAGPDDEHEHDAGASSHARDLAIEPAAGNYRAP